MSHYLKQKEFPKRRKSKDNPYQISYCAVAQSYTVTFRDGVGQLQTIVIDNSLYQAFNQFELDDLKELNEFDRHMEHLEVTEHTLNTRSTHQSYEIVDVVESRLGNERLQNAIRQLPPIQRSRLMRYYFGGLTYEEIAQQDGCSFQAVSQTMEIAKKYLRKFMKVTC